jgi:predicted PurR-regulated permease PerM
VVLLAIRVVSVIIWMVVAGLIAQGQEILARVTAGLEETGSLPGVVQVDAKEAIRTLGQLVQVLVSGLLSGLGSVTVLIVGIVTGLFILLFLMKDWRLVTDGTARQIAVLLGLPDGVGRQTSTPSTRSAGMPWGSPSSG